MNMSNNSQLGLNIRGNIIGYKIPMNVKVIDTTPDKGYVVRAEIDNTARRGYITDFFFTEINFSLKEEEATTPPKSATDSFEAGLTITLNLSGWEKEKGELEELKEKMKLFKSRQVKKHPPADETISVEGLGPFWKVSKVREVSIFTFDKKALRSILKVFINVVDPIMDLALLAQQTGFFKRVKAGASLYKVEMELREKELDYIKKYSNK